MIKCTRLRWACHVAGEGRSIFKILLVKPTGTRPLGWPRCRWEDIIRLDLKETGINAKNWVDLNQDMVYWRTLVDEALNLRFHTPWDWLVVY